MIETTALVRFGLAIVRPGMMVVAAPVLGGPFVPAPVRIALGVLLGIVVAPFATVPSVAAPAGILFVIAAEMLIGLALAMSVRLIVAAAELAGHLAGFQMGLSYAAIVDPQSGVRNNMLSALYANLAVITFLGIDGHHSLIRALAGSYQIVPIGGAAAGGALASVAIQMLGVVFVTGARLAAPVVTVLLLVEVALGLISRAAPQLNLMVVGTPLRLLAGLAALAFGVQVIPSVVASVVGPALTVTDRLLRALS